MQVFGWHVSQRDFRVAGSRATSRNSGCRNLLAAGCEAMSDTHRRSPKKSNFKTGRKKFFSLYFCFKERAARALLNGVITFHGLIHLKQVQSCLSKRSKINYARSRQAARESDAMNEQSTFNRFIIALAAIFVVAGARSGRAQDKPAQEVRCPATRSYGTIRRMTGPRRTRPKPKRLAPQRVRHRPANRRRIAPPALDEKEDDSCRGFHPRIEVYAAWRAARAAMMKVPRRRKRHGLFFGFFFSFVVFGCVDFGQPSMPYPSKKGLGSQRVNDTSLKTIQTARGGAAGSTSRPLAESAGRLYVIAQRMLTRIPVINADTPSI